MKKNIFIVIYFVMMLCSTPSRAIATTEKYAGRGFNSLSGELQTFTCFDTSYEVTSSGVNVGTHQYKIVNDYNEVRTAMDIGSTEGAAIPGIGGGTVKTNFASTVDIGDTQINIILRIKYVAKSYEMNDLTTKLQTTYLNNPTDFLSQCGTQFIQTANVGAELFIRFHTTIHEEDQSFKSDIGYDAKATVEEGTFSQGGTIKTGRTSLSSEYTLDYECITIGVPDNVCADTLQDTWKNWRAATDTDDKETYVMLTGDSDLTLHDYNANNIPTGSSLSFLAQEPYKTYIANWINLSSKVRQECNDGQGDPDFVTACTNAKSALTTGYTNCVTRNSSCVDPVPLDPAYQPFNELFEVMVGVIPNDGGCGETGENIFIRMDCENGSASSSVTDWHGASGISGNDVYMTFCKVDGQHLKPLTTDRNATTKFYAVLQFDHRCPHGFQQFQRHFDNEDGMSTDNQIQPAGASIYPNQVQTSCPGFPHECNANSTLFFCVATSTVAEDIMTSFPILAEDRNFSYGVFAGHKNHTFDYAIGTIGNIHTDDEDNSNHNWYAPNTNTENTPGYTTYSVLHYMMDLGRNSTMYTSKVK